MADILIDNDVHAWSNDNRQGNRARFTVDVDGLTIYQFFSGGDEGLYYRKSTNGGSTWGSRVTVVAQTQDIEYPSVWFDKWTTGVTGTRIHIAYGRKDIDDIYYNYLDTSNDSLGTAVAVATYSDLGTNGNGKLSITKARGGNLYIAYSGYAGGFYSGFYRSTDAGATWSSRSSLHESAINDDYLLFPGNDADNQDIWAIFADDSAEQLSIKVYDDSANSWAETAIGTTVDWNPGQSMFSGAIRHSDGHLLVAVATHYDSTSADLVILDIASAASITTKTNIITNADDWGCPRIYIDNVTDDIYVGWLGKADGSETFKSSVHAWYSKSTDGGSTWGTPVQYSASQNNKWDLWCSLGTPYGGGGGRFLLVWYMESDEDFYTNYDNSVNLAEATSLEQHSYRFRDDDGDEDGATWLAALNTPISRAKLINTRLRILVNQTGDIATRAYTLEARVATTGDWLAVGSNATENIDQENTSGGVGIGFGDVGNGRDYMGQGFIPDIDNITAVSLSPNSKDGNADIGYKVWIDEADTNFFPTHGIGGIGGVTLITNAQLSTGGLSKYTLSSPVSLTPGNRYVIMIAPWNTVTDAYASSYQDWNSSTGNPYADGRRIHGDTAFTSFGAPDSGNADITFRTHGISGDASPFDLATSTNFADGDPTTAQLTAPSGKTTGDFDAGEMNETSNPAASIDIGDDNYTELEWNLQANSDAVDSETYEFRLTIAGTPIDTYTEYPEWTIVGLTTEEITKSLTYKVTDPNSVTKSLKYTVKTSDSETKSLVYKVRKSISITKSLQYSVQDSNTVTKSLKYAVKAPQSVTKGLVYAVKLTDSIELGLVYKVEAPIAVTKALKYTVISPYTLQRNLIYRVLLTSVIQKDLTYTVLPALTITKSLKYTVLISDSVTKSLRYAVVDPNSVTKSLKYTVKSAVSITKSLTYEISPRLYSKEANYSLPADADLLNTLYSDSEVGDVATDNDVRVSQQGQNAQYVIHQFKYIHINNTDPIIAHWQGKTNIAPSSRPVYMEIFNNNSEEWEVLDSDNSSSADTDFDLEGGVFVDTGDYYDADNKVTVRVYQKESA